MQYNICNVCMYLFQNKLIIDVGFFSNRAFLFAVFFSIVGQMLVIYSPLNYIFQTEPLSPIGKKNVLRLYCTEFANRIYSQQCVICFLL